MKKVFLLIGLSIVLCSVVQSNAQTPIPVTQSQQFSGTVTTPLLYPIMSQAGLNISTHQLVWTVTGSISACTVTVNSATTFGGSYTAMTNTSMQTCTSSGSFTFSGTGNFVQVDLLTFTATTGVLTLTYIGTPSISPAGATSGYYFVPPENCAFTNTTVTGTPIMARAATGNFVLQTTTNAAAGAVNLGCDVSVPSRLLGGGGVTITAVSLLYGIQTTANTSITAATVNTVTYPASTAGGVAAAGTVAATAGGTLTVTPTVLQLTTTTSGQCFNEKLVFGTPLTINTDLTRVIVEQIYNQSAASAWTQQTCGAIVYYTLNAQ